MVLGSQRKSLDRQLWNGRYVRTGEGDFVVERLFSLGANGIEWGKVDCSSRVQRLWIRSRARDRVAQPLYTKDQSRCQSINQSRLDPNLLHRRTNKHSQPSIPEHMLFPLQKPSSHRIALASLIPSLSAPYPRGPGTRHNLTWTSHSQGANQSSRPSYSRQPGTTLRGSERATKSRLICTPDCQTTFIHEILIIKPAHRAHLA